MSLQSHVKCHIPYSGYNYFRRINFCGKTVREVFRFMFRGIAAFLQHVCNQMLSAKTANIYTLELYPLYVYGTRNALLTMPIL